MVLPSNPILTTTSSVFTESATVKVDLLSKPATRCDDTCLQQRTPISSSKNVDHRLLNLLVFTFRWQRTLCCLKISSKQDSGCAGSSVRYVQFYQTMYFSRDEQLTSYAEFKVQKHRRQSPEPDQKPPVRRLMCLSETCIIERDPASYMVVCARALKDVSSSRSSPTPCISSILAVTISDHLSGKRVNQSAEVPNRI